MPNPGEHHDGSEAGKYDHNGLRHRPHKFCVIDLNHACTSGDRGVKESVFRSRLANNWQLCQCRSRRSNLSGVLAPTFVILQKPESSCHSSRSPRHKSKKPRLSTRLSTECCKAKLHPVFFPQFSTFSF